MTQVADEKRQARLAGGLQTDEREAEQLQSVLLSAGRGSDGGGLWSGGSGGGGSSQGSGVTL